MSQASIETKTVDFNCLHALSEADLKPGLTIRLDNPSQADELVMLLSEDMRNQFIQGREYSHYQGGLMMTIGKSPSDLLLSTSKARKFQEYPYRGTIGNWRMILLPVDLSFVKNPEKVTADSAASFALHADALSKKGELLGEVSRTYTLYVRTRRNGQQEDEAPYLMMSSSLDIKSIELYMVDQRQEWSAMWRRTIRRALSHPLRGGLPSLGKRT